jgi:hypothetical protein
MTGSSHHDAFEARRVGLEAEYFRSRDSVLVDKLKAVFHSKIGVSELAAATGITDQTMLERMVALNVKGEMLVVFKLYPLVEVAWADGKLDRDEKEAVIEAAVRSGIPRTAEALKRLEDWLAEGPRDDMRKVWKMYAHQLRHTLTADELATFREDLGKYATRVAEASGGILGIVWQISPKEQEILDALKNLLTPS